MCGVVEAKNMDAQQNLSKIYIGLKEIQSRDSWGKKPSCTQVQSIHRGSMLIMGTVFIRAKSGGLLPKCPFNEICLGLIAFGFWRPMHHSQTRFSKFPSYSPRKINGRYSETISAIRDLV